MPDLYAAVEENGTPAAGGGVPTGTVEETTLTPQPSAPALSQTEVQQMIADALSQANQSWSKTMQSQLDRRDSNLIKRIEASKQQADRVAKSAKAGGLDEAAATALGQQFLNEDIAALLDEANKTAAPQGKTAQTAETDLENQAAYQHWITQQADDIRADFDMPYDAPEMKTIVTDRSPDEYVASVRAAGRAYRTRMTKAGRPANPARLPSVGVDGGAAPRNPIAAIDNSTELYKLAAQEARGSNSR